MDCLCLTARRAARALTRSYDAALRPSGLTSTQFGLLSLLLARPGLTQTQIAARSDMEQATLSRSLKLMMANGWVHVSHRQQDSRFSLYSLTRLGAERQAAALPLWKQAQADMKTQLGGRFEKTLKALHRVSAI